MDQDLANRKQRPSPHPQGPVKSKFFFTSDPQRGSTPQRLSEGCAAGPSFISEDNKENVCIVIDDDDDEDLSLVSRRTNVSQTQDLDLDFDDPQDGVEQEDGYMSPLSTYSEETQELSSPVTRKFTPTKKKKRRSSMLGSDPGIDACDEVEEFTRQGRGYEDDFDVDPVSSPISTVKKKKRRRSHSPHAASDIVHQLHHDGPPLRTPTRSFSTGSILVADSPVPRASAQIDEDLDIHDAYTGVLGTQNNVQMKCVPNSVYEGPDLRSHLGVDDREIGSEIMESERGCGRPGSCNAAAAAAGQNGSSLEFDLGQGSGSGSVLGLEPGSVSLLSPLLKTPADGSVISAVVISGGDARGDVHASVRAGAIGGGNGRIVIDVDALNMEMEVVQTEAEVDMEVEDPEQMAARLHAKTTKTVAQGWRMKWALGQLKRDDSSSSSSASATPITKPKAKKLKNDRKHRQSVPMILTTNKLRRNEMNVTPLGKHSFADTGTNRPLRQLQQQRMGRSAPPKPKAKFQMSGALASAGKPDSGVRPQRPLEKRSSLVFFTEDDTPTLAGKGNLPVKKIPKPRFSEDDITVGGGGSSDVEEISGQAWAKLNHFRYR
ncbi:hypothetical protein P691DRAFT_774784 [Macrolepiota fuliginosa MF-IS2]|uniref:Uncharacterized protein n=1 Tax=Macrolepiota fuliginosa MF-IS2 TaxID=1400762 RepID=A0A9P5XE21_9AGAR|nr:hypothetical protein P691DRAFT_774784 [Macrolepiota fuliginosa MF-IS2]